MGVWANCLCLRNTSFFIRISDPNVIREQSLEGDLLIVKERPLESDDFRVIQILE